MSIDSTGPVAVDTRAAATPAAGTVDVTTTAGIVRGRWRPGSAAFLGIPFAAPPVGELRFLAPVPHPPWPGVRDAGSPGATPQRATGRETPDVPHPSIPGESTLNVNVFTPDPTAAPAGGGLPVLVYIHGGAYIAGSPSSPWADGAAFNRHGVVTVNVSYRLGFDGFGWIEDAPLNRGVLDWLLALDWVQQNIAVFGGDPARVTIAGQSAGGGAVLTLLSMPRAQSLFAQALPISGVPTYVDPTRAEALGRRLAALAGVAPTRAGLADRTENQLIALQAPATAFPPGSPVGALGEIANTITGGLPFGPVVDGDLIPLPTVEAVRAGHGATKPLLLGSTDHEFNAALDGLAAELDGADAAFLLAELGLPAETAEAYVAAHPRLGTAAVLGQFASDRAIRGLAVRVAEARSAAVRRSASAARTWLWAFAWSPLSGGAGHTLDLPFFFDNLDAPQVDGLTGPTPPQRLADEVHGAAVAFIAGGAPGWPAWNPEAGDTAAQPVLRYDDAPGIPTDLVTVATTYAGARLAFAP